MPSLAAVTTALESIAPLRLAADWDAVGLLVSPRRPALERVMTCLSLTEDVANEAVRRAADLVVTHHPLPFRPVARLTDESSVGRVLLALAGAGTGVWSPHTAWDSAAGGINDQLAAMLGLAHVAPLEPDAELPLVGFGRAGTAPEGMTVAALARRAGAALGVPHVQIVGAAGLRIVELPVPLLYLDLARSFGGALDDATTRLAYYRGVLDRAEAAVAAGAAVLAS